MVVRACLLLTAISQALAAFAGAAPPHATVRAVTVSDEIVEGVLLGISATPAVELKVGSESRHLACADLLALEFRKGQALPEAGAAAIRLRNGDTLRGAIEGGSSRAVTLRTAAFGVAECPLSAIARIELPGPRPGQPIQAAEKLDRLLLRNGETIEGTLESLGATGIRFRSALLGDLEVAFDRLTAIVLAAQAAVSIAPGDGVLAIASADDGTTVSGQLKGLRPGILELQAAFGPALALRVDRLLSLEFRGGRLVYLSDLDPSEVRETPYFDLVWGYRRDRSVDGNPVRLGGQTFRKGLGVHSRCVLTYALGGAYRRFLATVGLDDEVGERGNVDVAVQVDGVTKFERKGLTGRDHPVPVALDVTGAARLTLVVDFGGDFDICDHVDWADARLIR